VDEAKRLVSVFCPFCDWSNDVRAFVDLNAAHMNDEELLSRYMDPASDAIGDAFLNHVRGKHS
jgi:hypothetical protein